MLYIMPIASTNFTVEKQKLISQCQIQSEDLNFYFILSQEKNYGRVKIISIADGFKSEQECIPVGCVPSAAVAIFGGMSAQGVSA